MDIKKFIESYKKTENKEQFIQKHVTKSYIGIIEKITHAENIVNLCSHVDFDGHQVFKSNSVLTYITFTMRMIDLYTDIDVIFKDGGFVEQYDLLNEHGIIERIIGAIPEKEYKEFNTIVQMKTDDLYQNEYSVSAILNSIKEYIMMSSEIIGKLIEKED